jgi:hypothetical protein
LVVFLGGFYRFIALLALHFFGEVHQQFLFLCFGEQFNVLLQINIFALEVIASRGEFLVVALAYFDTFLELVVELSFRFGRSDVEAVSQQH